MGRPGTTDGTEGYRRVQSGGVREQYGRLRAAAETAAGADGRQRV